MSVKVAYSTPMLHSDSIEKSIEFYELLGFELIDVEGRDPIGWARIHCEGGAIMFLRGEPEHPMDPKAQALILAMYTPDLPALREKLIAAGLNPRAISYPDYMPSGELMIADPDGYRVNLIQWGEAEQKDWEKRLEEKEARGELRRR